MSFRRFRDIMTSSPDIKRCRLSDFNELDFDVPSSPQSEEDDINSGETNSNSKTNQITSSYVSNQLAKSFQKINLNDARKHGGCDKNDVLTFQCRQYQKSNSWSSHYNGVTCSLPISDVEMNVDSPESHRRLRRNDIDKERLDSYRSYLADSGSDIVKSFHTSCRRGCHRSANNNANTDIDCQACKLSPLLELSLSSATKVGGHASRSMPSPPALGIVTQSAMRTFCRDNMWKYTLLPSTSCEELHDVKSRHGESAMTSLPSDKTTKSKDATRDKSMDGEHANGDRITRPRKVVSFTSSPSVKWFRTSDVVAFPSSATLVSLIKHKISHKKQEAQPKEKKRSVAISILKKRKHERLM